MYWLIEVSGEDRKVWGPYESAEKAKREAGKRHFVARGSGLANGQTMTRGELHHALQAGRIWSHEGINTDSIA